VLLVFMGCAYVEALSDPYPDLVETQAPLIAGCEMLGLVSESADADQILSAAARRDMLIQVKARAVQLGATHIVWLHKTDVSAAAEAYRCQQ
jgi:hypothetical protein